MFGFRMLAVKNSMKRIPAWWLAAKRAGTGSGHPSSGGVRKLSEGRGAGVMDLAMITSFIMHERERFDVFGDRTSPHHVDWLRTAWLDIRIGLNASTRSMR